MTASPSSAHDDSTYVSRNLEINSFYEWIIAPNDFDAPSGPERIRLVLGPAGMGKTTFFEQLRQYLEAQPAHSVPRVIVFPLNLTAMCPTPMQCLDVLHGWLRSTAREKVKQHFGGRDPLPTPASQSRSENFQTFAEHLQAFCGQGNVVVLLIDGWDDIDPDPPRDTRSRSVRSEIETELIVPFLGYRDFRIRVVVAGRDHMGFQARQAREEFRYVLEALSADEARNYADKRLRGVMSSLADLTTVVRLLDCSVEEAAYLLVQAPTLPNHDAVLRAVEPHLLGNPYVLNRLLHHTLLGHDLGEQKWREAIVLDYLGRVPLPHASLFLELLRRIAWELPATWQISDFHALYPVGSPNVPAFDAIKPLENAGLLSRGTDRGRLHLDPALHHLLKPL